MKGDKNVCNHKNSRFCNKNRKESNQRLRKNHKKNPLEQAPDLAEDFNKQCGFGKLGKKFSPYSKNIFKSGIYWLKSFKENYKITKSLYTGTIQANKVYYGEIFNKKRQKYVKKILIKSMNDNLKKLKTGFNKEIKDTENEFKTKTDVKPDKKS